MDRRFEEPPTVDVRQSICAVRIAFCCRSKYSGIDVSDAKKLKVPEVENAKLKKLLADPCPGTIGNHQAGKCRE